MLPIKKRGRPPGSKNKKPKMKKESPEKDKTKTKRRHDMNKKISKAALHEILVKKRSAFSCKECSKKFTFKKSYEKHILLEHSTVPGSIACDQCHVRCPDETTLQQHIDNIHNREIFQCKHCKKKFVRRSHVLRHMAQKGCGSNEVYVYPCEICEAVFSRKDNLMVHLRIQHIIKKEFLCKQCDYHTINFCKLILHWQKKHSETPNHFECDTCGKVTSSRTAIAKHMEIHGDKKYSCDVCGYSTFTVEVIRRHVYTHVQERPYKCSSCNHSFIQRSQLQRHMEKHETNVCNVCKQLFKTKISLLLHEREHRGLDKLVCTFPNCEHCDKPFSDLTSLKKHMKSHVEQKPFSCEVCGKAYNTEINMRRHMETHALERPRRCMYCVNARAYVRGMQLVKHVRKSHPAVFRQHLTHVRQVLVQGTVTSDRVKKSELDSILNVLDAESDRIMQGYSGAGVLYGGMLECEEDAPADDKPFKSEDSPLMSEEELADSLRKLLSQLVDKDTLECFGWPDESVDVVLEKVIEQCGARAADRTRWTRVQCLRENTKHLFLHVIEYKNIARMLDTHTIDQIVKHILAQVSDSDQREQNDSGK